MFWNLPCKYPKPICLGISGAAASWSQLGHLPSMQLAQPSNSLVMTFP
jgi:hypothetical protein